MTDLDPAVIAAAHAKCPEFLFDVANGPNNPMAGLAGGMCVTEDAPRVGWALYPPHKLTCPHGVVFWTYPNAERVKALNALNDPRRPSPDPEKGAEHE